MKLMVRFENAMCIASVAAILVASSVGSAYAQAQPPTDRCRPASKVEYNAAKAQYLLTSQWGFYAMTRRLWRRYYWYCRY
jgi:hypothetical protein